MLCSGCGKEIPFLGSVCPYCINDKSQDQKYYATMYVALLVLIPVLGYLGFNIFGFWGILGGFFLAVLIALGIALPSRRELAAKDLNEELATKKINVELAAKELNAEYWAGHKPNNELDAKKRKLELATMKLSNEIADNKPNDESNSNLNKYSSTFEDRLLSLSSLKEKGLITEEEYIQRKKEIISEV